MQIESITFVAGQLGIGGSERQLYLLASGLISRGYSVNVVSLNGSQNEHWETPLRRAGVSVDCIGRGSKLRRVMSLVSLLQRYRTSVVHAWNFHTNPYASVAGLIARVPVRVGSIREHPSYWPDSTLLRWGGTRGLDGIVANSHAAARAVSTSTRLYVVPNAVCIPSVDRRPRLREHLARRWNLNANEPWIVALGRLHPDKNWALLLEAARDVVMRGTPLSVVFVGDGPERRALEELSVRWKLQRYVRFVGKVRNAEVLLPAFDVSCLCSRSEGLPNALLEAAAAALPVVATDVGGTAEAVENGTTGFLVTPHNAAEFADRLHDLVLDSVLRRRMGFAGRERVKCVFSTSAMIDNLIDIYEQLLSTTNFGQRAHVHSCSS